MFQDIRLVSSIRSTILCVLTAELTWRRLRKGEGETFLWFNPFHGEPFSTNQMHHLDNILASNKAWIHIFSRQKRWNICRYLIRRRRYSILKGHMSLMITNRSRIATKRGQARRNIDQSKGTTACSPSKGPPQPRQRSRQRKYSTVPPDARPRFPEPAGKLLVLLPSIPFNFSCDSLPTNPDTLRPMSPKKIQNAEF